MRSFVLVFLAALSLSGSTLVTVSATCNGATYQGGDSVSCGDYTAGATAMASLANLFVMAGASAGPYPSTSSASASLSEDFILTVTGGYGDGYAAPELSAGASNWGAPAVAWAGASLGGCSVGAYGTGPPADYCSPTSVAFVFGVPQMLTLSESAGAEAGPWEWGTPEVEGSAAFGGFFFFDAQGQPLSDVTYTFVPVDSSATPEPATLPILAVLAAAAFIARYRRAARRVRLS